MLMPAGLPVSANAINKGCRRAHEGVPERQAPCGQPSPHRRKNCVSRNQAQTLAHERVTRQPPTLDYGSTERCKLLTRWAFEYFDQTGTSFATRSPSRSRQARRRMFTRKSASACACAHDRPPDRLPAVPSINSSLHEIGELVLVYLTPECRRLRLGRLRNAT